MVSKVFCVYFTKIHILTTIFKVIATTNSIQLDSITWTHSGVVSGWQALPQCGDLWSRALAVEKHLMGDVKKRQVAHAHSQTLKAWSMQTYILSSLEEITKSKYIINTLNG